MADWAKKLDAYLELSNYEILQHAGTITAEEAKQKAETEFELFRKEQDRHWISDFDREIKRLSKNK